MRSRIRIGRVAPAGVLLAMLLCLGWTGTGRTGAAREVEVWGEASLAGRSLEEARWAAVREARRQAVEAVAGVHLMSATLVRDFAVLADVINSTSYGHVVDVKVLEWRIRIEQPDPSVFPSAVLCARMRARVAVARGAPDPSFTLWAALNKQVFQAGEQVSLQVRPSRDCFLTVVNLTSDGKARILVPSRVRPAARVRAGRTFRFPSSLERAAGVELRVTPVPGHRRDREAVVVVGARKPYPLPVGTGKRPGVYTAEEFEAWLVSIPLEERTGVVLAYEVAGGVPEGAVSR